MMKLSKNNPDVLPQIPRLVKLGDLRNQLRTQHNGLIRRRQFLLFASRRWEDAYFIDHGQFWQSVKDFDFEWKPRVVKMSRWPVCVTFRQDITTAILTFAIVQNSAGDGTIDLSHILFKFKGVDVDGNSMDASRDEYSGFSKIV
jgi:hypothetical protein